MFSYSATLLEPEQTFVSRVLAQVPSLADSIAVAKRLNTLLRRKSGGSLEEVLEAAAKTAPTGFAADLGVGKFLSLHLSAGASGWSNCKRHITPDASRRSDIRERRADAERPHMDLRPAILSLDH